MIRHKKNFLHYLGVTSTCLGLLFICFVTPAAADKSSVIIAAPETAAKGTEIKIKVTAAHDANNFLHYTNWLYIMINGNEVARWDYSWRKRPEGKTFTEEITYTVIEPVEIKAEANCNLHGSEGPQTVKITVTEN